MKLKLHYILLAVIGFCTASCEKSDIGNEETPFAPYVLSLGITANSSTTYYVVTTDDLMSGTISAVGKGIEQNGFHDYEQGEQTIFCIGGLGVTKATGITRNSNGLLEEKGDFVFDSSLGVFTQINSNEMLGLEIPANAESGNQITFYTVNINDISIKNKKTASIAPLAQIEWPSLTGLCMRNDKVYVTYMHMNPKTFETKYTDTAYVAVFSYPEMTFEKLLKDTRTGPAGSWYAHNGMLKTENGDIYLMSNSSISNGYSQSTKKAAFLRIPANKSDFDDYYFDFETVSGGLKPAHIKYIGNGLVYAEVSTINPQTVNDRWMDSSLKCCIVDLNSKTVKDIAEIPVHNGNGGRRFAVLVDGGFVYSPITTNEGTYIYRTNPQTASAERGARVSTTFVAGFFKLS